MTNHRGRLFLAGALVGALAIAGYAVRSDIGAFPGGLSDFGGQDDSASGALDPPSSRASGSGSGSVGVGGSSDEILGQTLQAIRDSLQRNDLASARSLLNAVQAFGKDDKQVVALQKDLQAREKRSDDAPRVAAVDKPLAPQESAQAVSGPIEKSDRLRGGSLPVREHATVTSHHSRGRRAPQDNAVPGRAVDVDIASVGSERNGTTRNPAAPASLPTDPSARIPSAPISPPDVQPAQAIPPTQAIQASAISTASDQGPKTRAQVRAELERARENGALPRFGNPDPAGPGRTPNSLANSAAPPGHE